MADTRSPQVGTPPQANVPIPSAEERLELLEAVVLHANDAVLVTQTDADGEEIIVFVNAAFTEQTGYAQAEVAGRHPRLLVGPETERAASAVIAGAVRERRGASVELLHVRKDGSTYWVENSITPIEVGALRRPYIVSVQRDVSDRREAEEALRLSEERLVALLTHTSDIITVLEADGRVRYSNPSAGLLTGLTADVNGTSGLELVHPEDRDRVIVSLSESVRTITPEPVEFRMRYADGIYHHVEALANNCLDDPAVNGIVVTIHDVTERKAFENELAHQALHDQLTGLPNRVLLLDRLQHALDRTRRADTTVGVLFMDIDRFKLLNDSHGHHAGDVLLREVAGRLKACMRPGDTVARFGGDEFVVLCEEVTGRLQATAVAERILAVLDQPFVVEGVEIYVTASLGVSVPGEDSDAEALVRDADSAMYRAKERGRNRVELFDEAMRSRALDRLRADTELRRAVEHDQLRLLYQPVFRIRDGSLLGHEALVRWDHPSMGLLAPGAFLPLAEESGLIVPLGVWVLTEACRWHAESGPGPSVGVIWVNVSAHQISHPGLVPAVESALEASGLPPTRLGLELTESGVMEEGADALEVLWDLRRLGVRLALDDFGTGYSSLDYLTRLPVDTLKVDQSFVARLGVDQRAETVLTAVLGLAANLGLDVVAEGVETQAQLAELSRLGCDAAQGFLLGRPTTPEQACLAAPPLVGLPPVVGLPPLAGHD